MDDILGRLAAVMNSAETGTSAIHKEGSPVAENDDEVALLRALKPYLSPVRAQKLEEAIRLMGLMKLVPLLREGGK